jgi:hypothetical protein
MRWLAVILLVVSALRLEAVVVVVNEALPVQNLSVDRVRDMLLGRITTWDSGQSVTIVLCTDDAGEAAVAEISGRSVGLLQRGWKRLVFSGTGAMPLVVASRQAAFEAVVRYSGAIAVLMQADSGSGCRVITVGSAAAVLPAK